MQLQPMNKFLQPTKNIFNKTLLVILIITGVFSVAPAQLLLSTSSNVFGIGARVFEQANPGGAFSEINSGLSEMNYASLSRDGRFIHFSSPDPTEAVTQILPSSDIYRLDRVTGLRTRVFDYNTILDERFNQSTFLPEYNALSPDGRFLVSSVRLTTRQGGADPKRVNNLGIFLNNGNFGTIEMGRGQRHDFDYAEFTGISWAPDSQSFVTPAYITVVPGNPNVPPVVGIVRYALNNQGIFVRSAALSQPTFNVTGAGTTSTRQIFPALSPSGNELAYFDLASVFSLQGSTPTTARLIVADSNGANATVRTTFRPGSYPHGLTWSPDGSQLIFSIAPQGQLGGAFVPAGDLTQAVVQSIAPFGGDTTIRQISNGFLPTLSAVSTPAGPTIDLSQIPLSITPTSGGNGFTFSAAGLDPAANYILESTATLAGSFENPVTFSGAQIMGGIPITQTGGRAFFRLRQPN